MHVSHSALSTITTGGTSQTAFAENRGRKYLVIQNTDAADDLWVCFGKAASAASPSIKLAAGEAIHFAAGFAPLASVHVFGATTSATFTAWQG